MEEFAIFGYLESAHLWMLGIGLPENYHWWGLFIFGLCVISYKAIQKRR